MPKYREHDASSRRNRWRAIFLLLPDTDAEGVTVLPLSTSASLPHLRAHLHTQSQVTRHMPSDAVEQRLSKLLKVVPVYAVSYRRHFDVLPHLADALARAVKMLTAGNAPACGE